MKLDLSKEWCMAMAEREGDCEVGAGLLARDPVPEAWEVCPDCHGEGAIEKWESVSKWSIDPPCAIVVPCETCGGAGGAICEADGHSLPERATHATGLKQLEIETLRHMKHFGPIQLSGCSEPMRQSLISLGMHEPPLVDVDGNWVSLTEVGRSSVSNGDRS